MNEHDNAIKENNWGKICCSGYWRTFGTNDSKKNCFCIEPYSRSAWNELHSLTKKMHKQNVFFFCIFFRCWVYWEKERNVCSLFLLHTPTTCCSADLFACWDTLLKYPVSDAKVSTLYRFLLIFGGITPQIYKVQVY